MQPAGEGLHGAARHSTRMRSILHGPWHLLFNAWCTELRRGFCTLVLSLLQQLLLSVTHFSTVGPFKILA